MRALGDLAAMIEGARALRLRFVVRLDARSRRMANRPRITALRLIHPDEIETAREMDRAS